MPNFVVYAGQDHDQLRKPGHDPDHKSCLTSVPGLSSTSNANNIVCLRDNKG